MGRALARASMAHRARAAVMLAAVDLHPGQEFLLASLGDEGPCAIGELADLLGVEQPTITKMVRRLEPSGYVQRSPDPDDGRRTLVSLTPAGTAALEEARALWRRLDEETTSDLTEDEQADLLHLLGRVRASLEDC